MEREDEGERLTLSVLCLHLCLLVLDGLYPCVFPSLAMLVGDVVCHHGAILESVVSGVFPWVVSGSECGVLLLDVCVCRL